MAAGPLVDHATDPLAQLRQPRDSIESGWRLPPFGHIAWMRTSSAPRSRSSLAVQLRVLTRSSSWALGTPRTWPRRWTISCTIHFAKTKFVLHAGIAAGAFYRYIYNPYRAGTFKKNAPGRKKALVKAAATSLVVVHELKIASRDAQCDGPALKKLAAPIRGLLDAVSSLKAIETGSGLGAIATAATAFDKLKTASAGAGAVIKQK